MDSLTWPASLRGNRLLYSLRSIPSGSSRAPRVVADGKCRCPSCRPHTVIPHPPSRGKEEAPWSHWPEEDQDPIAGGVDSTKPQRLRMGKGQVRNGKYRDCWPETGTRAPPTWKPPMYVPTSLPWFPRLSELSGSSSLPSDLPRCPEKPRLRINPALRALPLPPSVKGSLTSRSRYPHVIPGSLVTVLISHTSHFKHLSPPPPSSCGSSIPPLVETHPHILSARTSSGMFPFPLPTGAVISWDLLGQGDAVGPAPEQGVGQQNLLLSQLCLVPFLEGWNRVHEAEMKDGLSP